MKLPDAEQFNFKDCTIAGDECWLITPKDMATKWTDENARFRSIIIRKSDHHVISHALKKFTNFLEKPAFQPWNNDWKISGRFKYDGSCGIISKHKGHLIFRTRGTSDARQLPNGHEIDFLIKKYPLLFDNDHLNREDITIITEWCTPSNIICLREFLEPTLVLLNIVKNDTGEYESQSYLDYLSKLWNVPRPEEYKYDTIAQCFADVEAWVGKEGIVLYSPDCQTLKKIKSSHYLAIHKISTGMRSISNVLDLFIESPKFTEYQKFFNYVESIVDHEVAIKIEDDMKKICDAYAKFTRTLHKIKNEIENYIRPLETRKEQAMAIQRWFHGWMTPLAFTLLDNKEIDDKMIQKSLEKILEL